MKYIALLRGINVGGHRKVEMKRLRSCLESVACAPVETYLNSGNAIFESDKSKDELQLLIPEVLQSEFGFEIQTLIKTEKEIKKIANAIPDHWKNNSEQKTDVAYLFPEVDTETSLDELPVIREFIDMRYVEGAILWNVLKKDYNRSRLSKITAHKLYQSMTVRNVNTARQLAGAP